MGHIHCDVRRQEPADRPLGAVAATFSLGVTPGAPKLSAAAIGGRLLGEPSRAEDAPMEGEAAPAAARLPLPAGVAQSVRAAES
jgi:hypothetical protein